MSTSILASIASRAGLRLLAMELEHGVDNEHDRQQEFEDQQMEQAAKDKKNQPLNPATILMATVLGHLKNHKLKAELPDDVGNSILVSSSLAQVLMALASLGWTHSAEEEVKGGLYCSGSAVTLEGPQPLRLIQTSIDKVTVWHIPQQGVLPNQETEDKAAQYPREDLEAESEDDEYLEDEEDNSPETEDPREAQPTK